MAVQGGRTKSVITSGGSAGSWWSVSKGSQPGRDAHRARALHPQLTSDLWRAHGHNRNGGRSRFLGLGGQGCHHHCRDEETGFVPCSGLLWLSEKVPGPEPRFLPHAQARAGERVLRAYWTELHVLDPHVRAGARGGRCPEVSGVLQARDFSFVPTPSHAGGICRVRVWSWLRLGTRWSRPLCSSWGSGPPASSPSRLSPGGSRWLEGGISRQD